MTRHFIFSALVLLGHPGAHADPALDGYADRVASWGVAEDVVEGVDDDDVCGEGFVLWHRDLVTDLCAPRCTSDAECLDGVERCAVLPRPGATLEARVFVDDDPDVVVAPVDDEEADAAVSDVVGVCDPFFDVEGVASADLVEVIDLVADQEGSDP